MVPVDSFNIHLFLFQDQRAAQKPGVALDVHVLHFWFEDTQRLLVLIEIAATTTTGFSGSRQVSYVKVRGKENSKPFCHFGFRKHETG